MNFDDAFELLILNGILESIRLRAMQAESLYVEPSNSRDYLCSISTCVRPAFAKNLCNAHYIRQKKGMDLTVPVRARKRNDQCEICKKECGAKGGWGLCAAHFKNERYYAIKSSIIKSMGGRCERCLNSYHISVYDFHHISSKDKSPSEMIANSSFKKIAKELSKCMLLCANCHRLEHHEF